MKKNSTVEFEPLPEAPFFESTDDANTEATSAVGISTPGMVNNPDNTSATNKDTGTASAPVSKLHPQPGFVNILYAQMMLVTLFLLSRINKSIYKCIYMYV